MKMRIMLFAAAVSFCEGALASCIPFDQARNHLGETQCVTGKVVRVKEGNRGVRFLDFCEDYRLCTFTVVVFPYDLKSIGDVRELAGRLVEIRGEIKDYDDRAEIVLENSKQLSGAAMHLPPLPKSFDVEQRGHFSAGSSRAPHASTKHKKKGTPTLPVESDDPESD
ncbi:MAG TPA: hypothetical protein VFA90_14890 [Terriglobales bacterium]|nr:hypothetical protein [Terriglobales bacterium]